MKLMMEQWRKYLAEDVSEATAATPIDGMLGQRFVVKGAPTKNIYVPAFGSVQTMFRDEEEDDEEEE